MPRKEIRECLTFDDVLLAPRKSDVLPADINLATNITKKIKLNTPENAIKAIAPTKAKIPIAKIITVNNK